MNSTPPRTVADFVEWTEDRFVEGGLYFGHGTDNALDEAAWLVGAALGCEPQELDDHPEDEPTAAQRERIQTLVAERIRTRKPLAYLLKEVWFAGLKFYVDERVIVPRSLIAEFILERFEPWVDPGKVGRALDLCTGSGCIAVALAHSFPEARVDATDISAEALAVARLNVERHGLRERVRVIQSDLFEGLAGERYDLIATNPPYVAASELETLPEEYRHEPALALAAGASGLDVITRILARAPEHLNPGGILVAEVGNSSEALQQAFPEVPFTWLTTTSGDESVFLLTAEQLAGHREAFAAQGRPDL